MTITDQPQHPPTDAASAVPDEVIDAVMANVDAGGLELLGPDGVLAEPGASLYSDRKTVPSIGEALTSTVDPHPVIPGSTRWAANGELRI